jgi:hypothetical protein
MSLSKLKQNRSTAIEKLVESAKAINTPTNSSSDDRFWSPTVDKSENGYAVIRFLPQVDGEDIPWVRYWDHGFQGPSGRWYIEKSLTSIGKEDPVSEANRKLWNSGIESDKAIVRDRKRRLHYVANILVLSDPSNRDNEGKVFLYKFGKKIFDKINDVMQPEFEDETPVNPFDLWEGADFKVKIRKVDGYRNYDKSEFDKPSALFDGDETRLEAVYSQVNPLFEFVDPSKYKTFEELEKRFKSVVGEDETAITGEDSPADDVPYSFPADDAPAAPAAGVKGDDDDDDTLSKFAKLAAEG